MNSLTQDKRNFKQLKESDRHKIEVLISEGYSQTKIAEIIGCSQSTISREIKRGSFEKKVFSGAYEKDIKTYEAHTAQLRCEQRNKNSRKKTLFEKNPKVLKKIANLFKNYGYSFEMIFGRIKYLNELNNTNEFCPCVATLYTYLHKGYFKKYNITKFDFPRMEIGKVNKPRPKRKNECKGKTIHERPENINNRSEAFHWEIDLIIGSRFKDHSLLTLTERKTRFELAFKIESKESKSVTDVLDEIERTIGTTSFKKYFKSITSDNGSEFLDYKGMTNSCINTNEGRTEQYYADPYSSYQRGTNEAMNKCLRVFFPKKTKFINVKSSEVLDAVVKLNNRPKKCLKFQTSLEAISNEDEDFKAVYKTIKKLIA